MFYPSSTETELAVIGAIVTDQRTHAEIFGSLTIDEFYNPFCRNAFIGARKLFEAKKTIDLVTMSEFADIEALSNCATLGLASSVPQYIQILKDKFVRRQFIDAGRRIIELAGSKEFDDVVELKSEIISSVDVKIDDEKQYIEMPEIVDSTITSIENRLNSDDSRMKYRIPWLDKKTKGLWQGDLIIVAARPSVGKSAFALSATTQNAFRGFKVAFFNLEMTKTGMTERMLANISSVSGDLLRDPKEMNDRQWRELAKAGAELSRQNIYMFDDIYSIEGVELKARQLKAEKGIDLLIIDYLQLMDTRRKFNTTNDKVTHMSRKCKLIAKELNIPVMVLSQLNRTGANKEPDLSHLRESGAIEQDADVVIFLHDENGENYAETENTSDEIRLIIGKQRNGERGTSKKIRYIRPLSRFMEVQT